MQGKLGIVILETVTKIEHIIGGKTATMKAFYLYALCNKIVYFYYLSRGSATTFVVVEGQKRFIRTTCCCDILWLKHSVAIVTQIRRTG